MHRFVHRSGVGVIAWRQASGAALATTCAPRDNHRRVVPRGRVVRGAVGYGAASGGNISGTASLTLTATATATAIGSLAGTSSITLGATGTVTAAGAPAVTVGRPVSDTSNAGWVPSSGVALYPMVDEVVPDALDYISTAVVGSVCEMALNPTTYPGSTTSQQLKYRASSSTGNSVIVRLKEGATTIRSATQLLTASDTEYTITLTPGEIAAITSGSLSVELESA